MKKNLQELSNQELLKEAKTRRFFFGVYLGLVSVMIVSGIISTSNQGVNTFTFLPVVFLGLAVTFWSSYDKVRKELKSRNIK
ncbi:MAG: hypothetical protein QM594_03705 [Niabella sp.]